uniref:Death domain-containing protein n=1 Tax=Amphimedon queenslandica TaxID=400682 RepID=A0A1X7UI07_AMPQE
MDKELWDAFILKKDHKEAVRLLRLQDPNVFYQNEPDLLHHSISRGWLDVTRDLINKYHFDPHQYYHHEPCLYTAAEGNHIDIVEYLMKECGCDPMMPATEHGNVPVLHKVASQGLLDVLKCIVMNIDGHIMDGQYWDTYGQSVLFRAVKHIDVLKYLINCHCCDVMTRDEYGKTLLHHAVEHIDVVKYLIKDCNCNVMVTDKDGQTPLHYAASKSLVEVIEYLLSTGNCDPLAKENKGKTPLQLAKGRQNSDAVIAIFKKFGNIKQSHPIDSYVNVLLVGNPGAGKSTLSHVIKETATGPFVLGSFRNVGDVEPCTAGVIPYKLQHRTLGNIILHDFAGHSEYYSSHSAVIENLLQGSGGLFLIVVNILEKEAVKQLYQWLSVVRNEAQKTLNQCHVIVIVSHVDEVSNLFEKRRKEVIQEIIVSERCDSVFLDCRKCGGSGVDSFFNKLSSACESIRSTSGRNSSLYCHMMYGLLEERKENILTLSDITLPFKHNDNYIVPDDKNEIAELLDSLHSTGLISVLKSEDKVWVVMNKGILLTEVDGILFAPKTLKKHADIASNTGIVSVPDLTRLFPKYDPDMLICFLKNMQLCQELDPSFLKMTNLIAEDRDETGDSASETQRRGERLLFFPCLLSTGRPKEMTCQVYQFGWCLHCTREHDFFPPRYFHVLSLRLAFKFSFSKGNKKLAEKLNHECKFWSNGFHWFNGHGVKVLVEIVDESQCVLVMMSCKKGYSDNMVSLRRVVIGEVMNVYKESCPSLKVEELIIDPEELAYPVNRPRERTVYGVFNLLSAINQERPFLGDLCAKGQKKLKEILSDESLIRADICELSLLGGRDIKEVLGDSYNNQDYNQQEQTETNRKDESATNYSSTQTTETSEPNDDQQKEPTTPKDENYLPTQATSESNDDQHKVIFTIRDLVKILQNLKDSNFQTTKWFDLGLYLGLIHNDLKVIETNYPQDAERCLKECLAKWLTDDIEDDIEATLEKLAIAVGKVKDTSVADYIKPGIQEVKPTTNDSRTQISESNDDQHKEPTTQKDKNHSGTEIIESNDDQQKEQTETSQNDKWATNNSSILTTETSDDQQKEPAIQEVKPTINDSSTQISESNDDQQKEPTTQKDSSTQTSESNDDQQKVILTIDDLVEILRVLKSGHFQTTNWFDLGLYLGLSHDELDVIEADHPRDAKRCLKECLAKWLKTDFRATRDNLVHALIEVGEASAAAYITSGAAGIKTDSQFPIVPDHSDDKSNESGNNTDMNYPESERPQKIE